MKKVIYMIAVMLFISCLFTACQKEEVKPAETHNGGGVTIRE
jgi:hypothetical protein